MKRFSKKKYLEQQLALLIEHFGVKAVQATLAKSSRNSDRPGSDTAVEHRNKKRKRISHATQLASALERLKSEFPDSYRSIQSFRSQVEAGNKLMLPEDMRHFASEIGMKPVQGRNRRELLAQVLLFLCNEPADSLHAAIDRADDISEESRRQGYSMLTDKLLRPSHSDSPKEK